MTRKLRRILVALFIALVGILLGANIYFDFSDLLHSSNPGWYQKEEGRVTVQQGDFGNAARGSLRDNDEIVALNN